MLEHVVVLLQQLGMTGYEAKAYVALVQAAEPLNGYEVAKRSGVPRSTIYEVLAKLVAAEAVFEVRSPGAVAYLPLPPASLLSRKRRDFLSCIDDLTDSLGRLAAEPAVGIVHHLRGRDAVLARARDLVTSASKTLTVSIWREEAEPLAPDLFAAQERGVALSVMAFGPPLDGLHGVYEHRFSPAETVLERIGYRLLVVAADGREVLVAGASDDDCWATFADDPAVVTLAIEYVGHDVAMQVLVEQLGYDRVKQLWDADPLLTALATGRPPTLPTDDS